MKTRIRNMWAGLLMQNQPSSVKESKRPSDPKKNKHHHATRMHLRHQEGRRMKQVEHEAGGVYILPFEDSEKYHNSFT